ncbi:LCP family protein [Pseudogracilibacillus auburnensis]|uniref:LCP family protein n=1 Tax=Pseudogracilibacillus auburnensis TaxID=1494959 RepID=UPI001A9689FB|nr:LCP family protein [Pseudogracilibacillus auburnensis]MBO1005965.1 LCP family protein [Pseudogracilibacillus auburnensis]
MVGKNNTKSRIDTQKPKRRLRKRIKFILLPLVLAFFAVTFYGAYLYIKADSALSGAFEDGGRDKSDLRDDYVDPKFDNVSILIMGVDENEGRKGREIARTDALILATLNKDEKSIKLLSIPRDSYVYIPEVGYEDKINHAHAFGGTYAAIETVERLLDIPVDYYVKLNFHAFVDVIDAIGGIEADVPYEVKESDSGDHRDSIHLFPGKQVLDGEEALAFARTRKKDSDVERGKRQLELIDSVINKSTSVTSVFKYDDIIEAVGNNLSTNMTFTEMKSFISYATHGSKLNVEKLSLEGYDYQPENIYYWQLDDDALQETIKMLKGHLELPGYVDSDNESTEFESADPLINN